MLAPLFGPLQQSSKVGDNETHIVTFDAARLSQVRHACEALADASRGPVGFRICTIGGGEVATVEPYKPPQHKP